MASHDSEVVRKADTIIAQADKVWNITRVKGLCFQQMYLYFLNSIDYKNHRA